MPCDPGRCLTPALKYLDHWWYSGDVGWLDSGGSFMVTCSRAGASSAAKGAGQEVACSRTGAGCAVIKLVTVGNLILRLQLLMLRFFPLYACSSHYHVQTICAKYFFLLFLPLNKLPCITVDACFIFSLHASWFIIYNGKLY